MSLQQLANVFNLTGIGLVMLVSLTVLRNYPASFFRVWTIGYRSGFALMVLETLAAWIGHPPLLSIVEIGAIVTAAWYFTQTALSLYNRAISRRWYQAVLAASLLLSALALAAGASYLMVAVVPLLCFSGSIVALGVVLIVRGLRSNEARSSWLGWPLILMGVLPITYPIAEQTSYSWVGYWLAGFLHLLVGIGMIIRVLDESAQHLRMQNERLTELSQLKTSFLSTISHELRTPLTSIMGYLEFLEDRIGGPLTPQQAEFVDHMKAGSSQLADLIDSLLDIHQIEAGALQVKLEEVDLANTIEHVLNTLRSLGDKKGLHMELALDPAHPMVRADQRRVVQVLNNLIGNAIKFTDPGGTIRLTSHLEGDQLRVNVADTGIGVPADQHAQIFDPFFQVDSRLVRNHGGSGLGLSIVRNMVQAMGGSIGVESEPGKGSMFWFTLPVAMAPWLDEHQDPAHLGAD